MIREFSQHGESRHIDPVKSKEGWQVQTYKNGVFSLVSENAPVPGCTVSGDILPGIKCFSLAENTNISAESYPVQVLQYVLAGETDLKDRDGTMEVRVREGQSLQEHAAPGESVIFALDGEGIIGYEGEEYVIHAGENFHFARGGRHYVKAKKPFKMALLLVLD